MLSLREHTSTDRAKLARRLAGQGIQAISDVPYEQYLRSTLWKSIRTWVVETQAGKCGICDRRAEEVHHHDYNDDTLWGEESVGLVGLCTRCHGLVEFGEGRVKRDALSEKRAVYERLCELHQRLEGEGFSLSVSKSKSVTAVAFTGEPEFQQFMECSSLAYAFVVSFEYNELSFPLPLGREKLAQKTGIRLSTRDTAQHIGTVWADARSITIKRTRACIFPLEERLLGFLRQSKLVRIVG